MEVDPNGKTQWSPLEYEFLPNFCYICGLLGHVDRECARGSWKKKKKPFGPELRVWPSRRRGLEDSKNRSLRSSGSGGPKSESNSATPGRMGGTSGSGSGSRKAAKGGVELGEESASPQKPMSSHQKPAEAKRLIWSDDTEETGHCNVGDKGYSADVKDNGDSVEKVSQNTTEKEGLKKNECRVEMENVSLIGAGIVSSQHGDTTGQGQEMDVAAFLPNIPHNQTEMEEAQACRNKKQRVIKKVKKANLEAEDIKNSLLKKRTCDGLEEGILGTKRQKMEIVWRDEEGDVVVAETDLILDEAGLPEQPGQTK